MTLIQNMISNDKYTYNTHTVTDMILPLMYLNTKWDALILYYIPFAFCFPPSPMLFHG